MNRYELSYSRGVVQYYTKEDQETEAVEEFEFIKEQLEGLKESLGEYREVLDSGSDYPKFISKVKGLTHAIEHNGNYTLLNENEKAKNGNYQIIER